jgi:hypothetical protein
MSRETLHRLVDELPEADVPTAERVLIGLRATADPVRRALDSASLDDEPESDEERAAVAEAWAEHRRGEGLSTEELRKELGLPL